MVEELCQNCLTEFNSWMEFHEKNLTENIYFDTLFSGDNYEDYERVTNGFKVQN
jgi:hypothetical protein